MPVFNLLALRLGPLRWAPGFRGCSAAGSAPRSHRGGQGFESPQLHLEPNNSGPSSHDSRLSRSLDPGLTPSSSEVLPLKSPETQGLTRSSCNPETLMGGGVRIWHSRPHVGAGLHSGELVTSASRTGEGRSTLRRSLGGSCWWVLIGRTERRLCAASIRRGAGRYVRRLTTRARSPCSRRRIHAGLPRLSAAGTRPTHELVRQYIPNLGTLGAGGHLDFSSLCPTRRPIGCALYGRGL